MSSWIVTLTRNNLELTKRAIESFRAQDIGDVRILVVENDSSDNTANWLASQDDLTVIYNKPQAGVAGGWNQALRWLMNPKWDTSSKPPRPLPPMSEYVLVVNNDVVLRPDTYRHLVADGGGFVTAVGSRDPEKIKPIGITKEVINLTDGFIVEGAPVYTHMIKELNNGNTSPYYPPPDPSAKRPHPDFSCYLIRRSTWERVGEFNESFYPAFCEDADFHIRLHRAGIKAEALELPFYHTGSATVNNADVKDRQYIQRQADKNRKLFKSMYGVEVGSDGYYQLFGHGQPPADVPRM